MEIDRRQPVRLGESTQWIRIRAANARNPLLLLIQLGPGLPVINEARTFGRLLSLEDDFTVIYWDQRGCGLSLRSADATHDLSVQAMVGDTERLLAMLCDRFGTPPVVAGFSIVRTIPGITAVQAALLPEVAALDLTQTLTRLNSPIVMIQGRHDQVAPAAPAQRYAGAWTAGQLFGAALVTDATGAQVTINRQPA
jgi:pimeloyl-ACP methyl ester carboxylesterase